MGNYVAQIIAMLENNKSNQILVLLPKNALRFFEPHSRLSIRFLDFRNEEIDSEIQDIVHQHQAQLFIDSTPFLGPKRFDFMGTKTVAIFYDLIPLLYPDQYLANEMSFREYREGIHRLVAADGIIFISKTVQRDFETFFPSSKKTIVIYPNGELDFGNLTKNDHKPRITASIGMHPSKNPHRLAATLNVIS
jgi:hypothetical protein